LISTKSLSKTLQDAVENTRAMGVKYLWVDTTCIIQGLEGENKDWQRELSNMGEVYAHSLFTIAASSAKDSSVVCFYQRKAANLPIQSCYPLIDKNRSLDRHSPVILEATPPRWNVSVEHSTLAKRGWVLQERLLASRTLFWTEDSLFWGYSELSTSEYEAEVPDVDIRRDFPLLHELVNTLSGRRSKSVFGHKVWAKGLEQLSQKAFTVATDNLAAVAGLGNVLSRLTQQEFHMGVWKHNMAQELAWTTDPSKLSEEKTIVSLADRILLVPS
jgi:hypothetical protein